MGSRSLLPEPISTLSLGARPLLSGLRSFLRWRGPDSKGPPIMNWLCVVIVSWIIARLVPPLARFSFVPLWLVTALVLPGFLSLCNGRFVHPVARWLEPIVIGTTFAALGYAAFGFVARSGF